MTAPQTAPVAPIGTALAELDAIATKKNAVEIIQLAHPQLEGSAPVASVPAGRSLQSVRALMEEYLDRPIRRRGEALVLSAAAFTSFVNRFKGASTAIFADPDIRQPSLLAVLNYHEAGTTEAVDEGTVEPGWCDHRVKLACRMSDEWKAWTAVHNRELAQGEFAAFLQDRIADCVIVDSGTDQKISEVVEQLQARLGGPVALMNVARGIEVRSNRAVKNAVSLEDGAIEISYVDEPGTTTATKGGPITVPSLFFITIPVFYAGVPYRIAVRLRYKVRDHQVIWTFSLYRYEKTFEHAFDELLQLVGVATDVPVFLGAPEK